VRYSSPADDLLVRIGRRAMACEFEICLPAAQYAEGVETALAALDLVEQLDGQMSVFRSGGELWRVNQTAADGPVQVEPGLFELLERALQLGRETRGAYDITAGPLWQAWGFARRAGAVPSADEIAEARSRVGGHLVQIDPANRTVRFLRPGVQLNLGSIGKGYAVDRCAQRLLAGGIENFLVHGGNSSVLARGSRQGAAGVSRLACPTLPPALLDKPAVAPAGRPAVAPAVDAPEGDSPIFVGRKSGQSPGWSVGLRDPLSMDRRLGEIWLKDRALGTSGAQFQSFRHRGRRYGHILDPRTGWPAEGVLSATVLAPTAALADALSTACYVLGPQAALAYCREQPELAAVIVCPGRGGGGLEIHATQPAPWSAEHTLE
jgi:thiamine biosynthesis lipoprotein